MSRCMSGNAVAKTSTMRPRSLPRYSVPGRDVKNTASRREQRHNRLDVVDSSFRCRVTGSDDLFVFRHVRRSLGHALETVLTVYADFDGSGRRCSRRHTAGDVPVTLLNTRLKWLCSAKPVTSATSERGMASARRSSWAFVIRALSCHWCGDNPVDALKPRPNCACAR